MVELTIQAFVKRQWQDVALLGFPDGEQYDFRRVQLTYLNEYAVQYLNCRDQHSVSFNQPVQMTTQTNSSGWFAFLNDLIPSGLSHRFWLQFLDIQSLTEPQQLFYLLAKTATSPIGNLRIKEALPTVDAAYAPAKYPMKTVLTRGVDFLEYVLNDAGLSDKALENQGPVDENGPVRTAQSPNREEAMIAAIAGAVSVNGQSPTLLLRCDPQQRVWIDTFQNDVECTDDAFCVKFPRGEQTARDSDVLRAEYCFYQELAAMGFSTIDTKKMQLLEGKRYPSLWLPRVDIRYSELGLQRLAVESLYSVLQVAADTPLKHEQVIARLVAICSEAARGSAASVGFDVEGFVIEWVRRDLLNLIFGNCDYSGRNILFVRDEQGLRLAPISEFSPSAIYTELTHRPIQWSAPLEVKGSFDFEAIALTLAAYAKPDNLLAALNITASRLVGLKYRLKKRGLPKSVLESPDIGFDAIEHKLRQWKLLK